MQRLLWFTLIGCAPQTSTPLVDASMWEISDTDPLPSHYEGQPRCTSIDVKEEDGAVEVETTASCSYLTLSQPLLASIQSTDSLHIVAWHGTLYAPEPAQAHFALLINEQIVWEESPAIPEVAEAFDVTLQSPVDADAGTEVYLHLHNHGANTWDFLTFEVEQ